MAILKEIIQYAKNAVTSYIQNSKSTEGATTSYAEKGASKEDLDKARSIFSAELLTQYDSKYGDGDGKLTSTEFQKAYADAMKEYFSTMGQMDLDTADLNYDGKVDSSDKDYKDVNYDGKVDDSDQQIYEEIMSQAFEADSGTMSKNADANKDGIISVEEMSLVVKMKDGEDSTGTEVSFDGSFSAEAETGINTWLTSGDVDMSAYASDLKTNTVNAKDYLAEQQKLADASNVQTQPDEQNQKSQKTVTVQAWGAKPSDGNKYANDSLSRIIANNYPGVKLYSSEYKQILNEIVELNGIKNPNVIAKGSELILP